MLWECSDWPTIPQLYVNGEFVGGCDILLNSAYPSLCCKHGVGLTRITVVHQSGELDELLVKNSVIPPEEAQKEES